MLTAGKVQLCPSFMSNRETEREIENVSALCMFCCRHSVLF